MQHHFAPPQHHAFSNSHHYSEGTSWWGLRRAGACVVRGPPGRHGMVCRSLPGRGYDVDPLLAVLMIREQYIEVSRVDLTDLPPRGDHHVTIAD